MKRARGYRFTDAQYTRYMALDEHGKGEFHYAYTGHGYKIGEALRIAEDDQAVRRRRAARRAQ